MVIIISNNTDTSANLLVDWLFKYKLNFIRLSGNDQIKLSFKNGEINVKHTHHSFTINEIIGVFTRSAWFNFEAPLARSTYFKNEYKSITEFFLFSINKNPNFFLNQDKINKLIVSNIAKEVGLKIPCETIVESKSELKSLMAQIPKLCTKSLSGVNTIVYKDHIKLLYTTKLANNHLDRIKTEKFYPSLIQEYVDKVFEVRSFVLNDKIFSMAIFSQNQNNACDDYRKDYNKLRTCVIKLPKGVETKIKKLLSRLNLRSGSIDLIYSKTKEFYFLEINPCGQFHFLSEVCNYNIEGSIIKSFLNK